MAQIYDISMKITNELPVLVVTNDITVKINNRKSTVLNVQAMAEEKERNGADDKEFIDKALVMLIGEKHMKEIDELDLPFPEYKEVFQSVMGIATGTFGETPTAR